MSIKFSRLSIFLAASALTVAISTNAYASTRLSGSDRYETSAKIALSGWTTSDYAVLASGEDYPDALTAAPLAGKYKAPVLLAEKDSIPDVTLSTISSLGIKNIFIVGGTGVISTNVESKLTSLGITVTRLSGSNRYETSIKVAEQIGSVSEIFAVSGEEYSDALSVAPIAVKNNMPIILIEKNSIPAEVTSYLATQNITTTYVIGKGTSITSDSSLPNVTEINGSDKYARNIAIINTFKSSLDFSTIYLATGENFADALSGSVLAGLKSNPLFLVGNDISATKSLIQSLAPEASINILGGTGAVSDNTVDNISSTTTESAITTTKTPDTSAMKTLYSNVLKELVTDSTITQTQSDKVLEVVTKGMPTDGTKPTGTAPTDGIKPTGTAPTDGIKPTGTVLKDDRLSELVTSEVITQAQADTINQKLQEAMKNNQTK